MARPNAYGPGMAETLSVCAPLPGPGLSWPGSASARTTLSRHKPLCLTTDTDSPTAFSHLAKKSLRKCVNAQKDVCVFGFVGGGLKRSLPRRKPDAPRTRAAAGESLPAHSLAAGARNEASMKPQRGGAHGADEARLGWRPAPSVSPSATRPAAGRLSRLKPSSVLLNPLRPPLESYLKLLARSFQGYLRPQQGSRRRREDVAADK